MRINFIRFLAMIAVFVTLFCTAAFAENPYQDLFYEIPSVGIIAIQRKAVPVMSLPDDNSEAIGSLNPGTVFRILGKYNRFWYIIDLAGIGGFEAGYGFVRTMYTLKNPSWLMMAISSRRQTESSWPVSSGSYAAGLIPVLDEGDNAYKSLTRTSFSLYALDKKAVKQFSEEGQELYFIPFGTPLYNDLHEEAGEIPGFTIVEITGEMVENYIPIKANPGKEDEFSGWIVNQTLLRIIN